MNQHWTVRLDDVAEINPKPPKGIRSDTDVAFVPMAAVSEDGRLGEHVTRPYSEVSKGYSYFERGDLLVAKITPCFENGKAALVDNLAEQIGFGSTEFHVLRPGPDLNAKYLFYMLWNERFRAEASKAMTGSAGQKRVPADLLRRTELRLPPLDEQRRIAGILDKADALRQKRKRAVALLDSLTQSIFLEMFGDPVTNPKGWETKLLGEVGDLDRGVSKHRPRNDPRLLGGSHPLIQTGDVARSNGYISAFNATYSDWGLKQSRKWPAGTLCITIAANIANTGILEFASCFPDSVVGFRSNTEGLTEYVRVWMQFLQKTIERSAPTVAQKNINLEILRALPIPIPPLHLLRRFDERLQDLRMLRKNLIDQESKASSLFASLQHRAFTGQL